MKKEMTDHRRVYTQNNWHQWISITCLSHKTYKVNMLTPINRTTQYEQIR
jgi:hypothetical protein